jgi:hypothetical protein
MLMIPDALMFCKVSPLMAWIDAGISRTFWALSLLAVTMISSRPPELAATVWAGDESGAANVAVMPTHAANRLLATPNLAVKSRPIVLFIADSPVIEAPQYELSYEISNKSGLLRTTHNLCFI